MDIDGTIEFRAGFRAIGFVLLCLVSVALTVVAQLLWIIVFDASGFDASVPDALFTYFLPALTLALAPALVARYLYTRDVALVSGGLVFGACVLVSTVTIQAFRLCGPGC